MEGDSCNAPCINCTYLTFDVDDELTRSTLKQIDQSPVNPSERAQGLFTCCSPSTLSG